MATPYALSSDLVSAWPAKSLEVAQYIDGQLPLIAMTQNAQTGTTYTLAATDFTKLVTLSNASPVTVTVPLESSVAWVAGTQLRLMNLGAGVVTVVGAGGVTINGSPLTLAQYKEGTLTKTGTNIWTFVGSPAAPGMDLITPTSVAGSGVTLSSGQVTFSAASTVSVNGCFSATYQNYVLVFDAVGSTSATMNLRMRLAGTDNTTSNWAYQQIDGASTSITGSRSTAQTQMYFAYVTTGSAWQSVRVYNPSVASPTFVQSDTAFNLTSPNLTLFTGGHNVSTAFDGFSIILGSGTMTGTLRVYGLRN